MDNKSELLAAERIFKCEERQVIKNMMALVLYDLAPERYTSTAKKLLTEDDYVMHTELEGSWVKAGEEFEGEEVDFYFDWGGEAALRLMKHGTFTKLGAEMITYRVGSLYPPYRSNSLNMLNLFDGLPAVDLSSPPKRADTYPYEQIDDPYWNDQISILKKWFEENGNRIIWDEGDHRYRVKM
ncbi:MAG: hypothetical protein WBD16_04075 [Pyrinomonadaceae bacterium]